MNLYISDMHFGHANVIEFDNRPFQNVDEMDRIMIELWNGRVQKDDDVYIVGDFAFRNNKPFEWYLKQLKGKKHLIIGNHDGKLLQDEKAMGYFEEAEEMMSIKDAGNTIELCHFPIAEWNHFHRGSYHIYGHIHNKTDGAFQYMKQLDRALNAACAINNYMPCSFNELLENNIRFKQQFQ